MSNPDQKEHQQLPAHQFCRFIVFLLSGIQELRRTYRETIRQIAKEEPDTVSRYQAAERKYAEDHATLVQQLSVAHFRRPMHEDAIPGSDPRAFNFDSTLVFLEQQLSGHYAASRSMSLAETFELFAVQVFLYNLTICLESGVETRAAIRQCSEQYNKLATELSQKCCLRVSAEAQQFVFDEWCKAQNGFLLNCYIEQLLLLDKERQRFLAERQQNFCRRLVRPTAEQFQTNLNHLTEATANGLVPIGNGLYMPKAEQ